MKVYIVSISWYSATDILAIFDTKEKATKFADQHSKESRNRRENYIIDEMVVK
jgi:hypothetical protein